MADEAPVTGIRAPPGGGPGRHLKDDELDWFDFDPSGLAEFVRRYGSDDELASNILSCRRAAWSCGSYVQFIPRSEQRGRIGSAIVANDDHPATFQDYAIDIDADGQVVGVELLHRTCDDA